MLEQNSNNQVSISKTNNLVYDSGNKKTTLTNTINETDVEGLKRKINSITQYQKPYISKLPQGYAVIIVAIAIFKMYDYLTTKYRRFSKMIVAKPILLVENGKILDESLLKARISREEFLSYLRLSGTDDVSEIKSSYLEINGQVSFIKKKKQEEEKIHTQ